MASNKSGAPKTLAPDVRQALETAVKRIGSQAKVARDLGISVAVVSLLLRDRYPGDVATMSERIRGQYMAETVNCPVMGELGRRHCLDYQGRPLTFTNPQRVRLFYACKVCPNRRDAA